MNKEERGLLIRTIIHGHLAAATALIHLLEAQELDPVTDWPERSIHDHLAHLNISPDHRELRTAIAALQQALPLLDKYS